MTELQIGLSATVTLDVIAQNTAEAMKSGSLPVLATPALACAMEEAACKALAGHLEKGQTSVGSHITLDHLAPTVTGGVVRVKATLTSVEGRLLNFSVDAVDGAGTVGMGNHTRVLVMRERFLEKAQRRAQEAR